MWAGLPPFLSVVRGEAGPGNPWLELIDEAGYLVGPGVQGFDTPDADLYADDPPGWDGELPRGVRIKPRTVFLPVDVHGASGPEFRARKHALLRTFNPKPDRGSRDASVTVRSINDTGDVRQITGRPEIIAPTDFGYAGREQYSAIGLSLRCASPWWTDGEPSVLRFATNLSSRRALVGAGRNFFPLRLSPSQISGATSVVIDGDVETFPVWTVGGPGVDLVVRSETLGQQWAISGTLNAGQIVTVDTRRGALGARDQAGINLWPRMVGSTLWPLVVGRNDLTVQFASASPGSFISLSYRRLLLDAAA